MRSLLLALLVLIAAGPASAQSLKATIDAQNAKWIQDFSSGNAAALAQLYTPQAHVLPAGAPMATGRVEIQKMYQSMVQSGLKNFSLQTISLQSYGRVAREIGRFTVDAPAANGATTHVEGKYVVIWRHEPAGWTLDTDIWNMDK
jgi:ketosteroid isomerase-like protein